MTPEPLVSIVVATCNRRDRLARCCEKIEAHVGVAHELIIVDGDSTDGTREWLAGQGNPRSCVILEERREGATRAYNKGFRAARGRYVLWLNDDSYPQPGAVEAAVAMIERPDLADVGMVAFYHNHVREWNRLDTLERDGVQYAVYNVRGFTYANFGLLRRELGERLGWLDERYYFCAWDPDLALKIQREAGLKVIGCRAALVYHEELIDDRKAEDTSIIDADNEKLFEKWQLPPKFSYPDPGPAYRGMLAARNLL
jgi:GT2 family glycosyltransferase